MGTIQSVRQIASQADNKPAFCSVSCDTHGRFMVALRDMHSEGYYVPMPQYSEYMEDDDAHVADYCRRHWDQVNKHILFSRYEVTAANMLHLGLVKWFRYEGEATYYATSLGQRRVWNIKDEVYTDIKRGDGIL